MKKRERERPESIERYAMLNSHSLSIYEVPTMCWALLHAKDSEVNKTDQTPCPHGA